jgi:hypothetical protein
MRFDLSATALLLTVLAFPARVLPIPGDERYVASEFAVVREEPYGAASVVAKITHGQAVVEIERQGNWLQVGVIGTGITGWVHLSFLTEPNDAQRRAHPLIPAMRRFQPVFDAFNDMNAPDGETPFLSASDRGNGVLLVTASLKWWSRPVARKQNDLMSLYQMWQVANEYLPVTVLITDPQGKRRLERSGADASVTGAR